MGKMTMKKLQRGFAMLEVLLAVIVIAMVSFGVYQLYKSSSGSSNAQTFESIVQQVMGAASQYGATNYESPADQTDVTPLLPARIVDTNGNILTPYGFLSYTAETDTPQSFYTTNTNIPGDEAVSICNALGATYAISTGGYVTDAENDLSTSCASVAKTGTQTLVFSSPKPEVSTTASS